MIKKKIMEKLGGTGVIVKKVVETVTRLNPKFTANSNAFLNFERHNRKVHVSLYTLAFVFCQLMTVSTL